MIKSQFKQMSGKFILRSLCLAFLFFLLRMDTRCMIYSRIQGEVLNNDTGTPISDAAVRLIKYDSKHKGLSLSKTIKTDQSGKFSFDGIIPGYYLIKVEREGFIPAIPDYKEDLIRGNDLVKIIKLMPVITVDKEGSIKHTKVLLKKGRTIKGQITGINAKDKFGRSLIHINLSRTIDAEERQYDYEDKITIEYGLAKPDNSFQFPGLEPRNDYFLAIKVRGFPTQYYENIDLSIQETVIAHCFYNEADRTGIKGTVRINGKVPETYTISLNHNLGGDLLSYYDFNYQNVPTTYPDGEFSVFMIAPGKYCIHIYAFDKNHQDYEKDSLVEVKKDETSIVNFNFWSE